MPSEEENEFFCLFYSHKSRLLAPLGPFTDMYLN